MLLASPSSAHFPTLRGVLYPRNVEKNLPHGTYVVATIALMAGDLQQAVAELTRV